MKNRSLLTLVSGAFLSGAAFAQTTADFTYERACVGEPTILTSTSTVVNPMDSIVMYEWDIDNDGLFDEYIGPEEVAPIFPSVTTWRVNLKVTTALGVMDTAEIDVVVTDIPTAGFDILARCINDPVFFTNTAEVNGGTIGEVKWDFGNGITANVVSDVSVQYGSAITYDVEQIAVSQALCSDTIVKQVTVGALPTAKIVTQLGTTEIATSQSIVLSTNETLTNVFWSTGETTDEIRVSNPGKHSIAAFDLSGCSVRDTIELTLNTDRDFIYNAFSPNADGQNDYWKIKNIDLYESVDVKIFDKRGALVFEEDNYQNNWEGDNNGNTLPEGVYYYHVVLNGDNGNILRGTLTILSVD